MNRRTYALLLSILLLLFLVLAARYASGLHLWGDEAYTLALVDGGISGSDPSHLPTYFFLLNGILRVIPESAELLLRMVHAAAFAAGLLFGAFTIRRITGDRRLTLMVIGVVILLPEFHFYATNLRMYAFLFLASMAFIHALFRIAASDRRPDANGVAWFSASGIALVAVDYPGLMLFAAGAGFLFLRWWREKQWRLMPVLAIPLLPFALFLLAQPDMLGRLLAWDMEGYRGVQWTGLFDALKWVYLSCRPALDLVYAAPLPTPVALALPVLLSAAATRFAYRYARAAERAFSPQHLVVLLAFFWVALIPTGFTFTRLFLPSQLFMVFLLVQGVRTTRRIERLITIGAVVLLAAVDLQQSVLPTYRLYSIIPYRDIAGDAARIANARGITTIFASDNSLNTLSIDRYFTRNNRRGETAMRRIGGDSLRMWANEHPGTPFLFIAHMGESGAHTDARVLTQRSAERLASYVSLKDLPYNGMWTRRYSERAGQDYAVEIWLLR